MKRIYKMYCLPWAGGSALAYNKWIKKAEPFFDVQPIELAGRGKRINEQFYTTLDYAVDDVFRIIRLKQFVDNYVIFGHSMGAYIAYKLYFKIVENGYKPPDHLFLSSRIPPHLSEKKVISKYFDKELIEHLISLGGIPNEFLKNHEFFSYLLPIVRADYSMLENYTNLNIKQRINCNLSVFWGDSDESTPLEDMKEWGDYTDFNFHFHIFNGGHFYLNTHDDELLKVMMNQLLTDKV